MRKGFHVFSLCSIKVDHTDTLSLRQGKVLPRKRVTAPWFHSLKGIYLQSGCREELFSPFKGQPATADIGDFAVLKVKCAKTETGKVQELNKKEQDP